MESMVWCFVSNQGWSSSLAARESVVALHMDFDWPVREQSVARNVTFFLECMEMVNPPFQAARSSNGIHHAMLSGECYRIYDVQNYALVDYFYSAIHAAVLWQNCGRVWFCCESEMEVSSLQQEIHLCKLKSSMDAAARGLAEQLSTGDLGFRS